LKVKKDIFDMIGFALLLGLILFFILSSFTNIVPLKVVVIDNNDPNSMHPTYAQGDIFVIQKLNPSDYEIGDVVVYEHFSGGKLIIHRIVFITTVDGEYYFSIKGDNHITNSAIDSGGQYLEFIHSSQILGKTIAKASFLGHISLAMQTNTALQILVLMVAGIMTIVIIFSKEDEKEKAEEEKYWNITKLTIKNGFLDSFKFLKSPKGIVYTTLTILTVALLILQMLIPSIFYSSIVEEENYSEGIIRVDIGSKRTAASDIGSERVSIVYYQVVLDLFIPGKFNQKLEKITISVYDVENLIYFYEWTMIGHFIGRAKIGAVIVIDTNNIELVNQQFPFIIQLFVSGDFQGTDKAEGELDFDASGLL
jgi:signal peptidase I